MKCALVGLICILLAAPAAGQVGVDVTDGEDMEAAKPAFEEDCQKTCIKMSSAGALGASTVAQCQAKCELYEIDFQLFAFEEVDKDKKNTAGKSEFHDLYVRCHGTDEGFVQWWQQIRANERIRQGSHALNVTTHIVAVLQFWQDDEIDWIENCHRLDLGFNHAMNRSVSVTIPFNFTDSATSALMDVNSSETGAVANESALGPFPKLLLSQMRRQLRHRSLAPEVKPSQ